LTIACATDPTATRRGMDVIEGRPGWYRWKSFGRPQFAALSVGPMEFCDEGNGTARVRFHPTEAHLNNGGALHGGAIMSFVDMALFAGGRLLGMPEGQYVTLDCATHFIARGQPDVPFDAIVRLVGETRGGMVFLSGHCEQQGTTTHSFTGTLKRIKQCA
jgi:acyl-coenzyme A thioesterase PaaI-like protein